MPKTKRILTDETTKRLYFYSLLFFALLLPFQVKWLPLTLGLMTYSAVWLFTLQFGAKLKLLSKNQLAALPLAYFVWVVLGGIYSALPGEAEKDIVLKIPFAAWPILVGSVLLFHERHRQALIKGFVLFTAAAILLNFFTSIYSYSITGDQSHLYFSKLVSFKMIPPHYLGMYINFAYAVVLYRLLVKKPLLGRGWVSIILLMVYFIALVFLSVRMQFITFAIVNLAVFSIFYKEVSLLKKTLWASGILVLMFALMMALPGPRSRMIDTVNEILSFEGMVNNKQTNARKFLWREGVKVCAENFWWGTGTGEADVALNEKLKPINAKFWDGKTHFYLRDKNYNFHNAYLQHWATHGFIGFIIFMAMFLVPLWRKGVPIEGKLFLMVCALSFITESMLQRQAGVLFFSFFYAVFFVMKPTPEIEKA